MNHMAMIPFLVYSTIGTTLWVVFLTAAGYFLGKNYPLVEEYLAPVSKNSPTCPGYLVYPLDYPQT
jgi:membrane protein DedA with SNARE-associated domain